MSTVPSQAPSQPLSATTNAPTDTTTQSPAASGPPPAPPAPTPQAAIAQVKADVVADEAAVKLSLTDLAAKARAEYDTLSEGAKGKIHQLLNDIEQAEKGGSGVVLAAMHTLFGSKQ